MIGRSRRGHPAITVRVQPRASRNRLGTTADGGLKVWLTAPPVDDRANRALLAFMADLFGVGKTGVGLESGARSRRKIIYFTKLSAEELGRRLRGLLDAG